MTTPTTTRGRVNSYFGVAAKDSTIRRELLAGASTFLAMSYIVVVNPAILVQGGIPWYAAFTTTALVGGLATVVMGLWARLPFAVAPGMEINALVVFSVIRGHGFSWQAALGLVFWSGVVMVAVTGLGWRHRVIQAIPAEIRSGLVLSIGVFIGTVGLKVGGLLDGADSWPGALGSHAAIALYLGFAVACVLGALRVRAAVLIAILAAAGYCAVVGLRPPKPPAGSSTDALLRLDLGEVLRPAAWGVVLVLFALDFFGSVAKVVGLSSDTTIQENGTVPHIRRALYVDSIATIVGAGAGSTSFVTFVESSVGIRAGARTGLAAVTTGALLLCCLPLVGVIGWIPAVAASGALLFVAVGMLPKPAELRTARPQQLSIVAVMAVVTALTSALDRALLAGLLVHLGFALWQRRQPDPALVVITGLLSLSVVLQYTS